MCSAVCCIGKLENHYIREWIEHYKKLGFDNIILYDNNDKDGEHFEEVISDYIIDGYVILENYRGITKGKTKYFNDIYSVQIDAYNDCYKKYGKNYDWIAFFDIDEFLMFQNNNNNCNCNINNFLKDFTNFDIIKINWKYYDDNDLIDVVNNDYSVVNRFTRHIENCNDVDNNRQCKQIIRTGMDVTINSAHGIIGEKLANRKQVDSNGNVNNNNLFFLDNYNNKQKLRLNHYRYKTIGEYIRLKMKRGWPDDLNKIVGNMCIRDFFRDNELTKEKVKFIEQLMN